MKCNDIDIEKFVARFKEIYSELYNASGTSCTVNPNISVMSSTFDMYFGLWWFRKLVSRYIEHVGDVITSDREAAAFMYTLDEFLTK